MISLPSDPKGREKLWLLQEKITVLLLRNGDYLAQEFVDYQVVRSQLFPNWTIKVAQILNPLGGTI